MRGVLERQEEKFPNQKRKVKDKHQKDLSTQLVLHERSWINGVKTRKEMLEGKVFHASEKIAFQITMRNFKKTRGTGQVSTFGE